MIHRLKRDIEKVLDPASSDTGCCGDGGFGGGFLRRVLLTVVGNSLVFFTLIFMLTLQLDADINEANEDETPTYTPGYRGYILLVCFLLLPWFSLVLSLLANSYYIMDLLISVNVQLAQKSTDVQDQLKDEYGGALEDALQFASTRSADAQTQLDALRAMSSFRKLLHGLNELYVIFLVFLWQLLAIMPLVFFRARLTRWTWIVDGIYFLLVAISNWQLFLLSLIIDAAIPFLAIGFLLYPLSIYILFRRKMQTHPTGNEADAEPQI